MTTPTDCRPPPGTPRRCPDNCPCSDASQAFDAWRAAHDPYDEMDILEQIDAYYAASIAEPPHGE